MVVIGRHEVDFPAVRVDNIGGTTQVTQHLIDLGHKSIGFISGPKMSTTSIDRLTGYKNALAQNGYHPDSNLIKHGNLTPESGYLAAKEIFNQENKPTAILAANDQMSFGACKAVRELCWKVPEDLAIAGFDDIPIDSKTYITGWTGNQKNERKFRNSAWS